MKELKKTEIVVIVLFLLALLAGSIYGMLYFIGTLFVKHLGLDVTPGYDIVFEFLHAADLKVRMYANLAVLMSFAMPIGVVALFGYGLLFPKKRGLHGDARFANKVEMVKAGLLEPDRMTDKYPSVIVGKAGDDFLLYRAPNFIYLAAPTRSGKGVGIVIPNCLHYRDSMVILDIKGENHKKTAGFRAKCGHKVYKFAPDDENGITECWNPLTYVREDKRFRVSDLMGITTILYPPNPDEVWNSTAENLFLGLALYIMDTPFEMKAGNLNIPTIKRYASSLDFLKDEETFLAYTKEREKFGIPLDVKTIEFLQKFAQTSERVRNSIMISFDAPLAVFADPITAMATSKSTFDFRDVRKKRMTIYVVIKPKKIDRFGKFLNLFFEQLLMENLGELPEDNPALKYQCLLLLDEFPAMGRVAIIEKAAAYMAGYNMRLLLIFQSKSQVKDDKLYGPEGAKTLLTNMALQIIYPPRDDDDARDYSEMIGYFTETGISRTLPSVGHSSRSESDQRRAVLLPQEVKAIGTTKAILSLENMLPALVDKVFYYKEKVFEDRVDLPVPYTPCQLPMDNIIEEVVSIEEQFGGRSAGVKSFNVGARFEVGFSPARNAKEVVISTILSAKEELLIAAYSITCPDIAKAIVEKHQKGIKVAVVVDKEQNGTAQAGFNACKFLEGEGINVRYSICYAAMHHKFIVVDKKAVQLGSFNYTSSAHMRNAESAILLTDCPDLADSYRREFMQLYREEQVPFEELMKRRAELEIMKKQLAAAGTS